jgi:hypothetical protein
MLRIHPSTLVVMALAIAAVLAGAKMDLHAQQLIYSLSAKPTVSAA